MSVAYRYAEVGAKYHFAPFEGDAFLRAFEWSRNALMARCDGNTVHACDVLNDAQTDAVRRAFEARGRLADGLEDVQTLARAWYALAQRAAVRGDMRDLNCALKLGDRVTQRGVNGLDANGRALVCGAVRIERDAIDMSGTRLRLKSQNRSQRGSSAESVGAQRQFGMLLVDSSRSRAYLDVLAAHGVLPARVVLVKRGADDEAAHGERVEQFDNVTPIAERLRTLEIPTTHTRADDINDVCVARAISRAGVDVIVYSGPPGVKVAPSLLRAGVELVHVHGGRLPDQRGSTTSYYSLLAENRCWASAIVMDAKLDRGAVIAQRVYGPPADRTQMDHGFDPWMRADLLWRVMRRYAQFGSLSRVPQPALGTMHYVMHPVLRHIVILDGMHTHAPSSQHHRESALAR